MDENRYLSENNTADYTGLSAKTLQRYRAHGTGPRFIKTLGRVLYDRDDLDAWLESLKRASTSEKLEA